MSLTSYNGYPASKDPNEIGIKSYPVTGTDLRLRCAESVGPLLAAFAAEFHNLIEPIDKGSLDDWGYAFRMVRGSTDRLSCHSSGTAIDLNATKHPLGKIGTFPAEKVPMIRALAKKYGLKWGGDFKSRADEMHFEVNVTPTKAKELITKLGLENAK
ncbi:D-alanyl-D-alanine carboxypeptidase [uncultured Caudovirales phage]|uniref:D-alanyl-D-alanine carboxypeptidase n=1 Tax=uncultured Caudovirales phage TaxID=2100421 RepID=A0A6J5NSY2_9CAUD|nr:D-alanyl-D-alanine carboxypeptidase [uncultured Caudovirales phage]